MFHFSHIARYYLTKAHAQPYSELHHYNAVANRYHQIYAAYRALSLELYENLHI